MRLQTLTEARWILAFFALLAVVAAFFSAWLSLIFLLLIFLYYCFFPRSGAHGAARFESNRGCCRWQSDGHN